LLLQQKTPQVRGVLRIWVHRLVVAGLAINRDVTIGIAARVIFLAIFLSAISIAIIVSPITGAIFRSGLVIAILVTRDGVAGNAAHHTADHGADDAMRSKATNGRAADGAHSGAGVMAVSAAIIREGGAADGHKCRGDGDQDDAVHGGLLVQGQRVLERKRVRRHYVPDERPKGQPIDSPLSGGVARENLPSPGAAQRFLEKRPPKPAVFKRLHLLRLKEGFLRMEYGQEVTGLFAAMRKDPG
jgi:hypothetical protein